MSLDVRDVPSDTVASPQTESPVHTESELAPASGSEVNLIKTNNLLDIRPVRGRKERITSSAGGEDPYRNGYDWPVIAWFGILHLGALAAPFFFTWKGFALFVVLQWMTGCVGVTLGYHRLLTHGSFATFKPVRWFLAFMGQMSGEGTALQWISVHRKHHAYSDQPEDPHSPRHGGLWAHINWMIPDQGRKYFDELYQRYAPDMLKDPGMRFLHKTFLISHIMVGALIFAVGYFCWDMHTAISLLLWGMFFRLVWVLHITWFVNSATHMWGYRNYKTTDDSTNLWWVGILAFGEGWHNNHHAYQRMARHGHRWWEFDQTYMIILAMEKLGLAWNVVHDVPGRKLHAEVDHA